jgi:ankyrin repeat protein
MFEDGFSPECQEDNQPLVISKSPAAAINEINISVDVNKENNTIFKMVRVGDAIGILCYLKESIGSDAIDRVDSYGFTMLHWAVLIGNQRLVTILINEGADVNNISLQSLDTPVSLAVKMNNVQILHYLLQHGGDIDYKGRNNCCLLALAAEYGSVLALEYLVY